MSMQEIMEDIVGATNIDAIEWSNAINGDFLVPRSDPIHGHIYRIVAPVIWLSDQRLQARVQMVATDGTPISTPDLTDGYVAIFEPRDWQVWRSFGGSPRLDMHLPEDNVADRYIFGDDVDYHDGTEGYITVAHAVAAYGARLGRLSKLLTMMVWDAARENGYCFDGVTEWRQRVNRALVNDDLLDISDDFEMIADKPTYKHSFSMRVWVTLEGAPDAVDNAIVDMQRHFGASIETLARLHDLTESHAIDPAIARDMDDCG